MPVPVSVPEHRLLPTGEDVVVINVRLMTLGPWLEDTVIMIKEEYDDDVNGNAMVVKRGQQICMYAIRKEEK